MVLGLLTTMQLTFLKMLDQENQPKLILTQVVSITPVEILSAGILAWKKVATKLQYSSNDYGYAVIVIFCMSVLVTLWLLSLFGTSTLLARLRCTGLHHHQGHLSYNIIVVFFLCIYLLSVLHLLHIYMFLCWWKIYKQTNIAFYKRNEYY